ncbi:hypothetical protein DUI87_11253 [Hirundo rustica rustica]|uniref:Rna-directed dna polymerase from mobile element jockey-like n=1 Tax=Hirundo rustica rustica TaxID=333673 RepID=A0A3M0KFX4_HIRRU|nr:hypothetical protein DUI87_11253 [Hirundo rustica rustica]
MKLLSRERFLDGDSRVFGCSTVWCQYLRYSEIECSLSKFADSTKLSSADNTVEGWDDIQGDLDNLEKLTHENLMK